MAFPIPMDFNRKQIEFKDFETKVSGSWRGARISQAPASPEGNLLQHQPTER